MPVNPRTDQLGLSNRQHRLHPVRAIELADSSEVVPAATSEVSSTPSKCLADDETVVDYVSDLCGNDCQVITSGGAQAFMNIGKANFTKRLPDRFALACTVSIKK